jgi:hypothetical protein
LYGYDVLFHGKFTGNIPLTSRVFKGVQRIKQSNTDTIDYKVIDEVEWIIAKARKLMGTFEV